MDKYFFAHKNKHTVFTYALILLLDTSVYRQETFVSTSCIHKKCLCFNIKTNKLNYYVYQFNLCDFDIIHQIFILLFL